MRFCYNNGMVLNDDIKALRFMKFRMSSILALSSHVLRFISPLIKPVDGVKEERMRICGMNCSLFTSDNRDKGTLLSLHGGAFAFPAAPYHKENASLYATAGFSVIMPDYPLLPMHHHPEAIRRITELAESIPDLEIIEGDSAGAFLALETAAKLDKKPCLMLIYPVVMMKKETESMKMYRNTPMWNAVNNAWMIKHYLRGAEIPEHSISGIKQAFIETAEYDPLHDEGIMLYRKLISNGADAFLSETEGTVHGYDLLWRKDFVKQMVEIRLEWLRNWKK